MAGRQNRQKSLTSRAVANSEIEKVLFCHSDIYVIPPECYQLLVVGQNVLTGLPFRARVGSISRTAARE